MGWYTRQDDDNYDDDHDDELQWLGKACCVAMVYVMYCLVIALRKK